MGAASRGPQRRYAGLGAVVLEKQAAEEPANDSSLTEIAPGFTLPASIGCLDWARNMRTISRVRAAAVIVTFESGFVSRIGYQSGC